MGGMNMFTVFRHMRKLLGDRALVIAAAFAPIMFLVVSIAISPWANDDTINKNFHAGTLEAGKTLWSQIGFYTDFWASSAGRFFPGSVTWTFGLFWVVQNRVAYKLIIAMILIAAVLMFSLVTWVYTKNTKVAALLLFIVLSTLQIRVFLDGLTSFTGLLPLTTLLTTTALLLSSRQQGWVLPVIGGILFQFALFTYETVILFVPALMLLVWLKTKRKLSTFVFAIPAALTAVIALSLRSRLDPANTPAAYSVSLDPAIIFTTFAKQASAALPMSQWWLDAPSLPPMSKIFIGLALIFVGIPVFIGLRLLSEKNYELIPKKELGLMAGVGIWIVLSSAAITSITARWQQDLSWGEGYLNVVYEYFGLALALSSLILLILQWTQKIQNRGISQGIVFLLCSGIAGTTALTVASNLVLAS